MDGRFWYVFLIFIALLASIPCFGLDLGKYKKAHRISFFIILIALNIEFWSLIIVINKMTNVWLYNTASILLLNSIFIFYLLTVIDTAEKQRFLWLIIFILPVFWILNLILFQSIESFFKGPHILASLLIIGLCIYFFYGLVFKDHFMDDYLLFNPFFWTISFIMFFFGATLLYFAAYDFLLTMEKSLFSTLSFLLRTLSIVMYFGFGLAFYLPLVERKWFSHRSKPTSFDENWKMEK